MKIHRTISESAFLVNESRARRVDISRDIYAQLWVSDSTKKLWMDFSKNVYQYDEIELGLRNRFFLDRLNSFINSIERPIFVNIGAGFTSYPFLVDQICRCVEVDLDHIIDFKRKRIKNWIGEDRLPNRSINFISADLSNAADRNRLKSFLDPLLKKDPSFILLEGITYYLEESILNNLFEIFLDIQRLDSILAFDFWNPRIEKNSVYKKLIKFFADRFGHKENSYNLFDVDFIRDIGGYKIIELTDIQKLEKQYLRTNILKNYEDILPENYAVLKRVEI